MLRVGSAKTTASTLGMATPSALPFAVVRTAQAAARTSLVRRIGRWLEAKRGHVITGLVSAGAVAAVALWLRPGDESRVTMSQPIADTGPGSAEITPTLVTHRPAEIEALDTPGGTGTVFNLQDEDGTTTVIWVTPEDTVEGI